MGAVSKSTYIPPVFILNAGKFAVIGGGVAAADAAAAAAAGDEREFTRVISVGQWPVTIFKHHSQTKQ